jgi:phosphinothricin acetyltransferase
MDIEWIQLEDKDYRAVKEIYDHYVLNTTVTFSTQKVAISELKETILFDHPKYKSYIIKSGDNICGFTYFSQYRKRQAYDRTAEISVYLKPEFAGLGMGKKTLQKMETVALNNGIFVLIGIITEENHQSVALFKKCGFEKCAHFKKVGEKFGRLLDVVVYQKILG